MIKQIKKIKPLVLEILTNEPVTRDNDQLLALKVWAHQNPNLRHPEFAFVSFARGFAEGKYANYESIRRSRALIQSENKELRGENYDRRGELGSETKAEIHSV